MNDRSKLRFSLFLQVFAVLMFTAAGLARGFSLGFDTLTWVFLGAGAISAVVATMTFIQYREG